MRFGLAMSSFVYSDFRNFVCNKSLLSLARTDTTGLEKPALQIISRQGIYPLPFSSLEDKFSVNLYNDTDFGIVSGNVNLFAQVNMNALINNNQDVTHVAFLWDDFIYNPDWLLQLKGLIDRHPDAIAWSVYRSSNYRHYHILENGVDTLMNAHDGLGCVTVEEWLTYRRLHTSGDFTVPPEIGGGCTLDVHHAYFRPGQRWATTKDYCQNIGVHEALGRLDQAMDFIGE